MKISTFTLRLRFYRWDYKWMYPVCCHGCYFQVVSSHQPISTTSPDWKFSTFGGFFLCRLIFGADVHVVQNPSDSSEPLTPHAASHLSLTAKCFNNCWVNILLKTFLSVFTMNCNNFCAASTFHQTPSGQNLNALNPFVCWTSGGCKAAVITITLLKNVTLFSRNVKKNDLLVQTSYLFEFSQLSHHQIVFVISQSAAYYI